MEADTFGLVCVDDDVSGGSRNGYLCRKRDDD
jgi:hypothetical protein